MNKIDELVENKNDISKVKKMCIGIFLHALKGNNVLKNQKHIKEILNDRINCFVFENEEDSAGSWDTDTHIVSISLDSGKDENELIDTIVHEMIHVLTSVWKSGEDHCGIHHARHHVKWSTEYGRGINEGITEWLTNKILRILPKTNYTDQNISFKSAGEYPMEQVMAGQLAILYGDETIIDAIMSNDEGKIIGAISKIQGEDSKKTYNELMRCCDCIEEINRQLKVRKEPLDDQEKERFSREKGNLINNRNDAFIEGQSIFLEKLLMGEIKNMAKIGDLKTAKELKRKIEKLSSMEVSIGGVEEANIEKYSKIFNEEYQKLVEKAQEGKEKSLVKVEEKQSVIKRLQIKLQSLISNRRNVIKRSEDWPISRQRTKEGDNNLLTHIRGMSDEEYQFAKEESSIEYQQSRLLREDEFSKEDSEMKR